MKLPEIVGIAGTNGSGKDALGLLFAERKGYHFHSVSELLREDLAKNGLEITRANQAALSKRWRNESGDDGIMFTKAIDKYLAEKEKKGYSGLALVNARHPGEVESVHKHGGVVIWIDADQRTRYERIQSAARGRSDDKISFEGFQADEAREMTPQGADTKGALNMAGVRDAADIHIENNFPTLDEYIAYLIEEFELN